MKSKSLLQLQNPLFLLSVGLLLLNDWVLKPVFSNALTGKLSDFAGVFAFAFFWMALFSTQKKKVGWTVAVWFAYWKSTWATPLLLWLNSLGWPAQRVVDYSDLMALSMVPLAYFVLKQQWGYPKASAKYISMLSLLLACVSFVATTQLPSRRVQYTGINKIYSFPYSKHQLVSRFNMLQMEYVKKANSYNYLIDFNSSTNTFHFRGSTDTLAILLEEGKVKDTDTIRFRSSYADIQIMGNDSSSALKLLSIQTQVPYNKDTLYQEQVTKAFEKLWVKKLK